MSFYQALYRKFRPGTFEGVVGQEHIVKTLKNQIIAKRVSHAYLFCGTRGTGKTSTAKIFAKAINCLNPVEGEPCKECSLCMAANEGRSTNVIEIDAASNNGVDNIREIREEVKYPPTEGEFKVYIIDEVHMLSSGAFNALLKTLEEPPNHVIFILATTDLQKIPATVLSRCQRFDFKRISTIEISATLKEYCAVEGIDVDDEALFLISRLADGSMRDSLSILDQCTAFYFGEMLTKDKVLEIVGAVDETILFDVTEKIIEKNTDALVSVVDDIMAKGRDIKQFSDDYITHLRNLLIASAVTDAAKILDVSEDTSKRLKEQANSISKAEIRHMITVFSELSNNMKYAANKRVLLELCFIRLCSPVEESNYDAIAAKLASLERQIKSGTFTQNVKAAEPERLQNVQQNPKKIVKKAKSEDFKDALAVWDEVVGTFTGPNNIILKRSDLKQLDSHRIYIVTENDLNCHIVENIIEEISEALKNKTDKDFDLEAIAQREYEKRHMLIFGATEEETVFDEDLLENLFPGIEVEP